MTRFHMWRQTLVVRWHIGWLRAAFRSTLRPLKWCGFIALILTAGLITGAMLLSLADDFRAQLAHDIAAQMREAK